ncbi:MAG: hypothetical protein H6828_07330 [Planctomycetes bacterium]|nr:hypothetical protein [Planctomycetota bacterium]
MNAPNEGCRDFLAALSRALEGRPQPERLTRLSWHEHLLGCAPCRDLLEREEALEDLLATLPEPKLPPDLARRVLLRLGVDAGLDALLDLDAAEAPAGLAGRVLAGVRAERALDALLDLDTVDVPRDSLPRACWPDRGGRHRAAAPCACGPAPRPVALAARGAAAAAAALVWAALPPAPEREPDAAEVARLDTADEPDPALLAALEVLERNELWDDAAGGGLLAQADADLEVLLFETFVDEDELLLDFQTDDDAGTPR